MVCQVDPSVNLKDPRHFGTEVSGQEFLCKARELQMIKETSTWKIRTKLITEHFEARISEKLRTARLS